jgi:hypothetical protein
MYLAICKMPLMSAHLTHMGTDLHSPDDIVVLDSNSNLRPKVGAFFLPPQADKRVKDLTDKFRTDANVTELMGGYKEGIVHVESGAIDAEAQKQVSQRIFIDQEQIRHGAYHIFEYMEAQGCHELHAAIDKKRQPLFDQHKILLHFAEINIHDTEHQDRDGDMARRIGEAFPEKISPRRLMAVVVASMVHDAAYIEAAMEHASLQLQHLSDNILNPTKDSKHLLSIMKKDRLKWALFLRDLDLLAIDPEMVKTRWGKQGGYPDSMKHHQGKKALDPHAPLGGKMMQEMFTDPDLEPLFANWDDDMKMVAVSAVENHSNGSTYDAYTVPLEAKLLRLTDKLDNCFERTQGMLTAATLLDPARAHRYVPSATTGMEIEIDKTKKEFRVRYHVDPSLVEVEMRKFDPSFTYTEDAHSKFFDEAYFKAMGLAAEVAHSLFAPEGELHAPDARFIIELAYVSGSRSEKQYIPVGTNTVFSAS